MIDAIFKKHYNAMNDMTGAAYMTLAEVFVMQMPTTLYTVEQASKRLNLPERTIYDIVKSGRLQSSRHGVKRGTIRISQKAINNYLAQFA